MIFLGSISDLLCVHWCISTCLKHVYTAGSIQHGLAGYFAPQELQYDNFSVTLHVNLALSTTGEVCKTTNDLNNIPLLGEKK